VRDFSAQQATDRASFPCCPFACNAACVSLIRGSSNCLGLESTKSRKTPIKATVCCSTRQIPFRGPTEIGFRKRTRTGCINPDRGIHIRAGKALPSALCVRWDRTEIPATGSGEGRTRQVFGPTKVRNCHTPDTCMG
jgi:hypothetical protein